jgi:hypothetical protein
MKREVPKTSLGQDLVWSWGGPEENRLTGEQLTATRIPEYHGSKTSSSISKEL